MIYQIINTVFEVYIYLIIAQVLMSWVPHDSSKPIFKFISDVTEPILAPCRRLVPSIGGIDFSPMIALAAVMFIQFIVIKIISALF